LFPPSVRAVIRRARAEACCPPLCLEESDVTLSRPVNRTLPAFRTGSSPTHTLARKEVDTVIQRRRRGLSWWQRLQKVRIDDGRLEQARDHVLSQQQLIR
jgi:hypothetical protein